MSAVAIEEVLHDGGVVVFRGRLEGGDAARFVALRSIVGRTPAPGEAWNLGGKWEVHPKHGRQVQVSRALLIRPCGRLLVDVLSRGAGFPGIGVARARGLWDALGETIYPLLDEGDPEPFRELLGAALADVLVEGWRAMRIETGTVQWLDRHGFPSALARKLIDLYSILPPPEGESTDATDSPVVWHLERDPYRMLAFAGWRQVDAAAARIGVAPDDERRQVGAVEAVLARRLKEGHTWASEDTLRAPVAGLLGVSRAQAGLAIRHAVEQGAVVEHGGGVQAPGCFLMERFVADLCTQMASGRYLAEQMRLAAPISRPEVEQALDHLSPRKGSPLTPEQRSGIWNALTCPISVLVGGPGVGKTTVLKAVHALAEPHGMSVHQAALSGRAAQRMAEATGRPAWTIASLLIRIEKGEVSMGGEPLVVLDESSMVDLATMYRLLRRFEPGVRVLLVGDPGQLPPIGFGLTFHVLARDVRIPSTTLTVPQRFADASGIPRVCEAIREGTPPELAPFDSSLDRGVSFVEATPGEITDRVIDLLAHFGGFAEAQVVGAVKRRAGGVAEINGRIHSLAAVGARECAERFFQGEPVIATRNDYDLGVMNGELGRVVEGDGAGGLICRFDTGLKRIPNDYARTELDLAYAITCHKSQGSQFRRVIVPVTRNRLLDRTLLLTAVSRAQEQVVLVGDRAAFDAAVAAEPAPSARQVGLGR